MLVTVGTFSILASLPQTSEQAIVKVQQGLLKGKILTSARSKKKFVGFLGIPYAKPPVGELKFKVTSETAILASCVFAN
jgi:Carboxylesterase type B